VDRSLWAVMVGTFTLRFSTGLTGVLLAVYLADLPSHGGPAVGAFVFGLMHASFYVAELVLAPFFGILSDRWGHHRVMQLGPIFGGVAVVLTYLTTDLLVLGGTRWLEGASTAASVPSILGYIAMATAYDEALRGRASARFEAATLAGLGVGFVAGPLLYQVVGPFAFLLNAGIYAVSLTIYRFGVAGPSPTERAATPRKSRHYGLRRYLQLVTSSHVLLLAPTWIAVNAAIGLWFSQSIFQFARTNTRFPDQLLHQGFALTWISAAAAIIGIVFMVGLVYWGDRFKRFRRTTIIFYGILGGGALGAAAIVVNHSAGTPILVPLLAGLVAAFGLFVLAGATPAAVGLLADISESYPTDRGAIMGLYSVFLALGQISGSLLGGLAAEWRGIDGLLLGTLALLGVALVPLQRLRSVEHEVLAAPDHEWMRAQESSD
jgi:MFS family permease